jgi:hypothetical protein
MASTKPFNPVMHCADVEPQPVYNLAIRVITQGIYTNTTLFPVASIPVTIAAFQLAVTKLGNLISQAKGNSNIIKQRDEQAVVVHNYLQQLLDYSKPICNHVKTSISLSGFDSSNESMPTVIPPAPVITKVTEGKAAGTYKVLLERHKKSNIAISKSHASKIKARYTVQTTTTPTTESSWVTQLESAASTKLILTKGIVAGKNYIRVYGVNSAGKGQPSSPFTFTPQL